MAEAQPVNIAENPTVPCTNENTEIIGDAIRKGEKTEKPVFDATSGVEALHHLNCNKITLLCGTSSAHIDSLLNSEILKKHLHLEEYMAAVKVFDSKFNTADAPVDYFTRHAIANSAISGVEKRTAYDEHCKLYYNGQGREWENFSRMNFLPACYTEGNTHMGDYYIKIQNILEAEKMSYDSGYKRLMELSKGQYLKGLVGAVTCNEQYVNFVKENLSRYALLKLVHRRLVSSNIINQTKLDKSKEGQHGITYTHLDKDAWDKCFHKQYRVWTMDDMDNFKMDGEAYVGLGITEDEICIDVMSAIAGHHSNYDVWRERSDQVFDILLPRVPTATWKGMLKRRHMLVAPNDILDGFYFFFGLGKDFIDHLAKIETINVTRMDGIIMRDALMWNNTMYRRNLYEVKPIADFETGAHRVDIITGSLIGRLAYADNILVYNFGGEMAKVNVNSFCNSSLHKAPHVCLAMDQIIVGMIGHLDNCALFSDGIEYYTSVKTILHYISGIAYAGTYFHTGVSPYFPPTYSQVYKYDDKTQCTKPNKKVQRELATSIVTEVARDIMLRNLYTAEIAVTTKIGKELIEKVKTKIMEVLVDTGMLMTKTTLERFIKKKWKEIDPKVKFEDYDSSLAILYRLLIGENYYKVVRDIEIDKVDALVSNDKIMMTPYMRQYDDPVSTAKKTFLIMSRAPWGTNRIPNLMPSYDYKVLPNEVFRLNAASRGCAPMNQMTEVVLDNVYFSAINNPKTKAKVSFWDISEDMTSYSLLRSNGVGQWAVKYPVPEIILNTYDAHLKMNFEEMWAGIEYYTTSIHSVEVPSSQTKNRRLF